MSLLPFAFLFSPSFGLTSEDKGLILEVIRANPPMSVTNTLLVAAKCRACWKRTASVFRADARGWHFLGATALRMLDFDVSLQEALQIFNAIKKPTLNAAHAALA